MSSKAKGARGKHGGGGGGEGKSDGKKESSAKRCKKCTALLPMMYKMKDKLAELHPQCNQYKLELEALRAENQELRRQLAMPPSVRTPSGRTAPPMGSTNSSVSPVRQRAVGSSATTTTAARGGGGGGGGGRAAAAAGASSKKESNGAAVVASRPDAGSEKRKTLAPSSGGTQGTGLTASLGLGRGTADSGGGKGGGGGVSGPAGSTAAMTAPARKDRSKGEKVRDWTAAVARRKRERGGGGDVDENGKGAAGRGGGGGGGGGSGSTSDVGGGWGGLEKGGEDSVEEEEEEEEDKAEEAAEESGETVRKKHSSSSGGGDRKKGKGKKKRGEAAEAPAAVQPTGVFAAAAFSFLDEGSKEKEGGEATSSDDDDDDDSTSDDSDGRTNGRRQNQPRKRARTANGGAAAADAAGGGSSGDGGRRCRSGPVPQTSSMLARGFRPGGQSATNTEDGVEKEGGGEGDFDDGWEEGEGQQEEEEVEWYEDTPGDMGRLGWSQVWRRGDATAAAAGGGEGDDDGDGLDKGSRALARKCRKLLLADTAGSARSLESGDEILGPKGLSALLRLELTGAVSMEGVLVSALRGRSLKRDHGFLGRLALQLLSGIDAAHVSPLSDPEVLSLVVEELEGLAEILAAPSTTAQLRGYGWARETRLALELLSETFLGWMNENQAKRSSGAGDAENGDAENDDPGGYSSMSFGNSKKKKKKKAKAKGVGADASAGSSTGKGGVGEEGGEGTWRAEAEATVLWWWETDEEARVPWAVARLLGLLLRRLDQPQRTQAVLHPILVRSLGGPARLRRFPLAFLEAFPGLLLRSSPTAAEGHANGRHGEGQEEDVVKVDGGGGVLAPGLWRRAVAAVLFPPAAGGGVNRGGGAGGDNAGVVSGGGGSGDGAAVVSARLKLVWFGDVRQGQQREGGGPEEETADDLADKILQAIGSLHSSPRAAAAKAGEEGGCALCRGDGGWDDSGGACGGDDALAMSSGLVFLARGAKEEFPGELAVPRGRGESIAVEAVRALGLLGVGMESGGFPVLRRLVPAIRRPGVCQRAAALACHVLAQCAAAGRGSNGGRVVRSARGLDMRAANAARALMDALRPDSEAEKWEAGQLDEDVKLPFGARAQAASALLSLLEGRYGESAAESEQSIVEWAQRLKPEERLSAPLPLLLSITATLSRPPAHVINLARRPFRWKAVSDSARRQGVWLHRHEAVDWKAVEASSMSAKGWISDKEVALTWATELNTIYDKDCEKETTHVMHPSERACAASHLDLWRRHRDSKLAPFMPEVHPDAVLILEDDAKLEPGFLEAAKATMLQAAAMDTVRKKKSIGLSKEWDIIYLGHILPVPIMDGIARASKTKKNAANSNGGVEEGGGAADTATTTAGVPAGDTAATEAVAGAAAAATALGLVVAPVTFAWGLHAYLLTRPAATRLADSLPVSAPADIFVASMLTSTDSGRPVLAGRAVLPALATTAGAVGGGDAAAENVGDVVSTGTRRAGAANGVRLPPGMGPGAASRGRRSGGGGGGGGAP